MTQKLFNPVIYLIGFPASGKYTTAKAIVSAQPEIKLIDNHLINNPIFSVLGVDGKQKLPEQAWHRCKEVWLTVLKTMKTLSPKNLGFVLTNVLIETDNEDHLQFERVQEMAEARGVKFFPIHLICDVKEMENRIENPDRKVRFKTTDKTLPKKLSDEKDLIKVSHPNFLKVDTTNSTPEETAEKIIKHIERTLK